MSGEPFQSKLLLRQLRNALGAERAAELAAAGRAPRADLRGAQAKLDDATVLNVLLTMVDDSYVQYERDLELRLRSLEISSDELNQAIRRAEHANRAKGDFLANMSHEIRTPMNGITGMLDLLDGMPLDAVARRYVGLARSSAGSLLHLLNEILDYSKIESGHLDLETITFNPRALVEDVLAMLEPAAAKKGLLLRGRLDARLPAALIGDPTRLRQILGNLVTNAIKFTAQGAVDVEAEAEPLGTDRLSLKLKVRDTGIGISEPLQRAIFQPFVQADTSTTRRFGGTGLGLAICAQLTAAMQGTLTVHSTPGQGSEFVFCAQFQCPGEDSVPADAPAEPSMAEPWLRGRVILVAEDNPVNQIVAEALLSQAGATVVVAQDGVEAVERCNETQIDAILMDMQMPRMDGLQATMAIREAERLRGAPGIPILGLTANAMDTDRAACLAAGMTAYLSKPVRATDLYETLSHLLRPR